MKDIILNDFFSIKKNEEVMRIHAVVEKNKTLRPIEDINLKVGETMLIDIDENHLEEYRALQKRNDARNLRIPKDIDLSALRKEVKSDLL